MHAHVWIFSIFGQFQQFRNLEADSARTVAAEAIVLVDTARTVAAVAIVFVDAAWTLNVYTTEF